MKIELLYFGDCPSWQTVLQEVQGLLTAKGIEDKVDLVRVASRQDAERLKFPGSPTIRIDGEDVDPEVPSFGFELACRVYEVDERLLEKPPLEWIDAALDVASE